MQINPDHNAGNRPVLRYGDRVIIHDGSKLDGSEGLVYKIVNGEVQVLLDREVFWMVAEQDLEPLKKVL
ncbi:MAG: hypothetical protein FIB02_12475 [Desulfuromonas sp.]|nr:hypothetical protein [Desulfuromonas sp.]